MKYLTFGMCYEVWREIFGAAAQQRPICTGKVVRSYGNNEGGTSHVLCVCSVTDIKQPP